MNPEIEKSQSGLMEPQLIKVPPLIFDSFFESGNLDMAVQIRDFEYDLYMRVDSNTRGHH